MEATKLRSQFDFADVMVILMAIGAIGLEWTDRTVPEYMVIIIIAGLGKNFLPTDMVATLFNRKQINVDIESTEKTN